MSILRPERPTDADAIHAVVASAFPSDAEARLVRRLRTSGKATLSLVAEDAGEIVGHVLFSPVTVGTSSSQSLGLAPLAVLPARQKQGIGSALIREGLARCREAGYDRVVVLGHPDYYARFGFVRASDVGLSNEYGADEAFMVVTFRPDAEGRGLVRYAAEFAE